MFAARGAAIRLGERIVGLRPRWYGVMREQVHEQTMIATRAAAIEYARLFWATTGRSGLLILAYVGWVAYWGWPSSTLGPLRADSPPLVLLNVALAALLLGLGRIGIAAARAGELW